MSDVYCDGSGRKSTRRKRVKQFSYYSSGPITRTKWVCPECNGLFSKKKDGTLHRHKPSSKPVDSDMITKDSIKTKPKPRKVLIKKGCSNCGADLYEIDYLCPGCRANA